MTKPVRNSVNRLLVAALAAVPMLAGAASGEFSFVTGDVSLTKANGQRITPAKGTPVDPGDRTLFINIHPEAAVRDETVVEGYQQ